MDVSQFQALICLPFVLPICLYVAYTDMKSMKITNQAVMVLALLFIPLGLISLSLPEFGWRMAQLGIVLAFGIVLNAGGAVGAGDAKFAAAAAPYIALGDTLLLFKILAAALLGAVTVHRVAKHTALRRLAPDWESWDKKGDFPMGLALGTTLAIYLLLGALNGS